MESTEQPASRQGSDQTQGSNGDPTSTSLPPILDDQATSQEPQAENQAINVLRDWVHTPSEGQPASVKHQAARESPASDMTNSLSLPVDNYMQLIDSSRPSVDVITGSARNSHLPPLSPNSSEALAGWCAAAVAAHGLGPSQAQIALSADSEARSGNPDSAVGSMTGAQAFKVEVTGTPKLLAAVGSGSGNDGPTSQDHQSLPSQLPEGPVNSSRGTCPSSFFGPRTQQMDQSHRSLPTLNIAGSPRAQKSNPRHTADSMELFALLISDNVNKRLRVELSEMLADLHCKMCETLHEAMRGFKTVTQPQHPIRHDRFDRDRKGHRNPKSQSMDSIPSSHSIHTMPDTYRVVPEGSTSKSRVKSPPATSRSLQSKHSVESCASSNHESWTVANSIHSDHGNPLRKPQRSFTSPGDLGLIDFSKLQTEESAKARGGSTASAEGAEKDGRFLKGVKSRTSGNSAGSDKQGDKEARHKYEVKDLKGQIEQALIAEACFPHLADSHTPTMRSDDRNSAGTLLMHQALISSVGVACGSSCGHHSKGSSLSYTLPQHELPQPQQSWLHKLFGMFSASTNRSASRARDSLPMSAINSVDEGRSPNSANFNNKGSVDTSKSASTPSRSPHSNRSPKQAHVPSATLGRTMHRLSFGMLGSNATEHDSARDSWGGTRGSYDSTHSNQIESKMADLRTSRVNEILYDSNGRRSSITTMESLEQEDWWSRRPPHFLQVCGVLPWTTSNGSISVLSFSVWYQWISLVLSVCALGGCMEQIVSTRRGEDSSMGNMCYGQACLRLGLFSDASLALGAFFGLLSLGTPLRSRFLVDCYMMLITYARRYGFLDRWSRVVNRDLSVSLVILALSAEERIRTCRVLHSAIDGSLDVWGTLQTVAFIFYSTLLLGLTLAVLQFCRNMMIMIDVFCYNVVNKEDLSGAVHEWNMLQAILRRASDAVQRCFFVLQTTALCFVFSGVTDVILLRRRDEYVGADGEFFTLIQTLIPGLLVTAGVARIFFCAAAVTDKCFHVPSLVNSLSYGDEVDPNRQYVVEYIQHSAAGFYVFEVRLTSALALKFMYFCGAAIFTVATTVMTGT